MAIHFYCGNEGGDDFTQMLNFQQGYDTTCCLIALKHI